MKPEYEYNLSENFNITKLYHINNEKHKLRQSWVRICAQRHLVR